MKINYGSKCIGLRKILKKTKNNLKKKKKNNPFKYKVGDKVRISYLQSAFQREYDIKWSGEIFKLYKRFLRQNQPIYKLIDWYNSPVKGTFYQKELFRVNINNNNIFKIEKVIKYKGRGKNKQANVRWLNWPKKFDSCRFLYQK